MLGHSSNRQRPVTAVPVLHALEPAVDHGRGNGNRDRAGPFHACLLREPFTVHLKADCATNLCLPLGVPIFRWFDNNGASGVYQLQTYAAHRHAARDLPTYADAIAGKSNTNPVVLDANRAAQNGAGVVLQTGHDAAGRGKRHTVYTGQRAGGDGLPAAVPDQWIGETNPVAFISTTSFQITGVDVTGGAYHTGRRVKVQVSAGTRYGTVRNSSFAVNIVRQHRHRPGLTLDAGLSAVSYGWNSWADPSYLAPRTAFSAIQGRTQTGFAASTKITAWTVQRTRCPGGTRATRWVPKTVNRNTS